MTRMMMPAVFTAAMLGAGAPQAAGAGDELRGGPRVQPSRNSPACRPARNSRAPSTSSRPPSSSRRTRCPMRISTWSIDMASEDSGDKDRDGTMRGADIFDVAHFPTAHYVTKSFAKTASGYTALGALTLHGVTKDVPIAFTFTPNATGATLSGNRATQTPGLRRGARRLEEHRMGGRRGESGVLPEPQAQVLRPPAVPAHGCRPSADVGQRTGSSRDFCTVRSAKLE